MSFANCKRENRMTILFGTVALGAAAVAAKTALQIAATPIDPLGLPKLPFRVAKLGVTAAVAATAGVVTASRMDRRDVKDRIRNALRPGKS